MRSQNFNQHSDADARIPKFHLGRLKLHKQWCFFGSGTFLDRFARRRNVMIFYLNKSSCFLFLLPKFQIHLELSSHRHDIHNQKICLIVLFSDKSWPNVLPKSHFDILRTLISWIESIGFAWKWMKSSGITHMNLQLIKANLQLLLTFSIFNWEVKGLSHIWDYWCSPPTSADYFVWCRP